MLTRFELVIAGAGLAAARAIKSYRESGGEGRIALIGGEPTLPYHRPALSKGFLRGETSETPYVEDAGFYRDNDVDVVLGTPVAAIEPGTQTVTLDGGSRIAYGKLLVATGAKPRRLRVAGADLEGVFSLRTVVDSAAIRDAAGAAKRGVVVGGGFIGMEVAASLRQLGVDVALVHAGDGLFDQLRSPQLSAELASLYRDNDVDVLLSEHVASFVGRSALEAVRTKSGREIEADLAVVGVGVAPAVDLVEGAGIALANGVLVNSRFESSAPDLYAVGDVANVFDPLYGRHRRIEHWSSASYQGTEVGKFLAGRTGVYDTVSSFFSEVFGVGLKVFGDVSRFDDVETLGTLAGRDLVVRYTDRGRLVGALTAGRGEDEEARLKHLIAARTPTAAFARERAA